MEIFTKRNWIISGAGILAGALIGFFYYETIGCSTGACMITSNPWVSTLYGGLLGFFVAHRIVK
ncbi:MAG: DUF6132 family protein [Cyclobacteriaceae bacterium]|nr:hypothetical protein [Cyclobacteriaceae bacterium]MCH8515667.1 DUF6132 family protein [Cyclobacteriaceae bacterium]